MDSNKLLEILLEVRASQSRMEVDILHHNRRTETLENRVDAQEIRLSNVETGRENIKFLGKTLTMTLATIATVLGILYTIIRLQNE